MHVTLDGIIIGLVLVAMGVILPIRLFPTADRVLKVQLLLMALSLTLLGISTATQLWSLGNWALLFGILMFVWLIGISIVGVVAPQLIAPLRSGSSPTPTPTVSVARLTKIRKESALLGLALLIAIVGVWIVIRWPQTSPFLWIALIMTDLFAVAIYFRRRNG